ncbi:N-acylneuraminate-9-phosphatase [Bradysia coprophila]|uniref:N-acylneuraminate-9-phosphatase n=1 Tax=Bradysia coprophila TaxID=38358 RepID=UPI00187D9094|nr:N-acylneuraminate-9-phosphatase [Bradysia coprophila]
MASKIKNIFKATQKQITTIIFDLDNTLIPTRKADSKVIVKVSELLQQKYAVTRDTAVQSTQTFLRAFRRCPDNPSIPLDTWRQHLWTQALPESHKHLSNEIYCIWLELRYRYLQMTPEIISLLELLRQTYILAIITNGPSNAQWEKIQRLNVNKFFDCVLVSGDLPWEKPAEHIFLACCNYLGVSTQNCVMIGDKLETDIQGGIDAKLGLTVWLPLNGDSNTNLDNIKPDYTINNLQELLAILPDNSNGNAKKPNFRTRANARRVPYNRRVASLPDLESGNSNSSDGS